MSTPTSDDPVAAKSLFLTTYMSNHVDTLVAYILHHLQQELEHAPQSRPAGSASSKGKKREADGRSTTSTTPTATEVKSPKMLKIDSREMAIQYTDGSDGDKVKKVIIPFDPPLLGYEEVRPRLLDMKLQAENAVGMSKRPVVSIYRFPTRRNTLIVLGMMGFWLGCALQENPKGTFGRIRELAGGWWTIRATGLLMFTLHCAEAAFQFRSCQRFSVPMDKAILWTLTTFVLGFAGLLQFKQVVREARVASVAKSR